MTGDALALAKAYFTEGRLPDLPDGHFIGGKIVANSDSAYLESHDPGNGRVFARFAAGKSEDVARAVEAAEKGLAVWRATAPGARCRILNRAAEVIRTRSDDLSVPETTDSGKTLAEARSDVAGCARLFEYYAGLADKLEGRSIPLGAGLTSWTEREPVGITAQIIPWNYPTSTFASGVAPALAAGCAVVAKPAETTPFTALVLAQWLHEAGVPDGVVNVVTGLGPDAGAPLPAMSARPFVWRDQSTRDKSPSTIIGLAASRCRLVVTRNPALGVKRALRALMPIFGPMRSRYGTNRYQHITKTRK